MPMCNPKENAGEKKAPLVLYKVPIQEVSYSATISNLDLKLSALRVQRKISHNFYLARLGNYLQYTLALMLILDCFCMGCKCSKSGILV